jgi:hypothetical protein
VSSVYATYQQGGSSIQVAIHNMGTPDNASAIFNFDLPVSRIDINKIPDPSNPSSQIANAVLDMGLPTAYRAIAFTDQLYLEVSIDDRSDAAQVFVKTFTLQILNRGKLVTQNLGDMFKEALVAARAAVSPVSGMELGARVVQLQQLSGTGYTDANGKPAEAPPMHLTSAMVDGRYQNQVGEGGLLTSYVELGGSHDSNGGGHDGLAGMGFLRLSSARLEGSLSARVNTQDWAPVGHTTPTDLDQNGKGQRTMNDARMGTLRDQTQLNVTGYPFTWLPVTALFTRQGSYLTDGSGGAGVVQHAIARVQLNKAGLPATTLQFGTTELDNPNAFQMHRLQGSAQTDYDLAPLLSFTHIKRFNIRALYSISQAETDEHGSYAHGDRVQLTRIEAKFQPTVTESVNALFRSREVERQTELGGSYLPSIYHWEMQSGAQSTIIPGLVPKLSYNVFFDDCRVQDGCVAPGAVPSISGGSPATYWSNTGEAGSAVTPPGPAASTQITTPTRTVNGSIGGSLGIYPGQWWSTLAPLALLPSLAVGDSERTDNQEKTTYERVYDYVTTEVWAGRKLEVMLYQRYRYTTTGPTAAENATMTVLQNRIVYRPVFTSPITLLINYEGDRTLNEDWVRFWVGPWAARQTHQDQLEWLMRWNRILTTRARLKGTYEHTSDTATVDSTSGVTTLDNHTKYSYGGELQLRFYPLEDISALFIYVSAEYRQWSSSGDNPFTAWEILPAGGVIWRLGDKIYLDAHMTADRYQCLSGAAIACQSTTKVVPYGFFTMNL